MSGVVSTSGGRQAWIHMLHRRPRKASCPPIAMGSTTPFERSVGSKMLATAPGGSENQIQRNLHWPRRMWLDVRLNPQRNGSGGWA